ncbi:aldehyde dehydrogenase family protein [Sphingomonas quercus]|uniref:Aldehyde dehydrogenase family protein n=1 Tax=Sphingomonas quercus TaxID=2842451 RepID=A0ABS6BMP4_9SPHN|nr:aldehyde dehydrogenase family protein [Sphingomonas quercus]MBU3079459.1 aldehyde dehydrogenase family protein [Sphingomonas quercus]
MDFGLLIDGALIPGAARLDVVNPATGKVFARAPRADSAQAERAIAAAGRAFPGWAGLGYAGRRRQLESLGSAIAARAAEFARLITEEQGKPLDQASGEVSAALSALRWFARQELGPRLLRDTAAERIVEDRYPLGVVAAITPWNYPLLLLMVKLAPALITGNTVIAKPAPTTPLTTLLLGEVAAKVLPPGVFQTLVDDNDLGPLLTGHPGIAHVSFTGSTATGKKVLASAADTLKRFTLELGGNDPAIILDDADIAAVAPRIFEGAMMNAGQVCLAVKRVYAPRPHVDALCAALARLAEAAVVGDGLEQGTTIGPIQNRAQYDRLVALIEETRAQGNIVAGGVVPAGEGYFIPPTIVRDLPDDARLVREEQFGPVLPVLAYDDLDDAIARANASEYGLGATIWTGDVARGLAVAARIESGTVWVNRNLDLPFDVPFGGARQSGIGRQQGIEGLEDFTQARIINAALG